MPGKGTRGSRKNPDTGVWETIGKQKEPVAPRTIGPLNRRSPGKKDRPPEEYPQKPVTPRVIGPAAPRRQPNPKTHPYWRNLREPKKEPPPNPPTSSG